MLILATARQDGPLVLREVGATKLECVTPRLQAHGPLTFQPYKLHIPPEVCQVNQTHAHRMSPTREVMSSTACRGSASHVAERRRANTGNPTTNSADDAGKPQFSRAAASRPTRASGASKTLAREGLRENKNSLREAAHSRTPGLPSHNPTSKGDSAHSTATN